ncbi:MAG: hypothetical protein ACOVT5_12075 [Armatimonadaceae bacterium]
MNIPWWGYVILAGLSWGTYVPIIFFGGGELSAKPGIGGRLMAIICVGVAYLVLAIVIPVIVFLTNQSAWQEDVNKSNTGGYIFAGLAGVMGAVGAICVVFASSAAAKEGRDQFAAEVKAVEKERDEATDPAVKAAKQEEVNAIQETKESREGKYRILIAPLIFSIAPIVNTLLASFWHPKKGVWNAAFEWKDPGLLFWLGIVLVAAGTGLVLYAKESSEVKRQQEERLERQKKAQEEKGNAPPTAPATNP